MYEVDRQLARARCPDEWKDKPWTAREAEAYQKKRKAAKAGEAPTTEA
jgi:hypothetical protein